MEMNSFALSDPEGWRADAACRDSPMALFFEPGNVEGALAICSSCSVWEECLTFALKTRQEHGVWGGLTDRQRIRLRRDGSRRNVGMKRGHKDGDAPWVASEVDTLRRLSRMGSEAIAVVLRRSRRSVERKAQREGISLRRLGERRGKAQGEGQVDPLLRDEIVEGRVRLAELEERVRAEPFASLCPSCALRPIEVGRTGLCKPCHAKRVLEAYEDVQEGRAASRALDAARARAYRKRHSP